MKITPLIFDSYFVKVPILFFLVIHHFVAFCWNKIFSVSFLSASRLYFFITRFLSRTCCCTVSTYFQISFNNVLPNKQTNENRWKNNSCVTIEWKLFCLSCNTKDCEHYTSAFKIYKSLLKESRRLRTLSEQNFQWLTVVIKV